MKKIGIAKMNQCSQLSRSLDQKGFSLVEVMIGLGLLGMLALGATSLFQSQNKQQSRIVNDRELENYHFFVSKILTNIGHCNATLKPFFDQTSLSPATAISKIELCTTNCTSTALASEVVTAAAPFVTEGSSNYIDKKRKWIMKSISFNSTQSRTGLVGLRFEYESANSGSSNVVIKDSYLNVKFQLDTTTNTYKFKACADIDSGANYTFEKTICTALSEDSLYGVFKFNTTDNTCAPRSDLNQNCSTVNQSIDGVSSTGSPICKTIANTPAPVTTAVNCTGKKLKFAPRVDANTGTTLKIECN